jgi:adenine deaminase
MKKEFSVSGNIIDVINERIFKGTITVSDGKIVSVVKKEVADDRYILPGLIDAHIHVESSMLVPTEFAKLAVTHGTVATVSDPHEIGNVLGIAGVKFMIENGEKVPFKFFFGAPSCVPATVFETSGANLGPAEIGELLDMDKIKYLSEMMNFPGVLYQDKEVMAKIEEAKKRGKPVDGHAPGLKGKDAEFYAKAGISTDHECFTIEEALDKIKYGMKIQIREGSAARNFEALIPLMKTHPDKIMLCSDDRHPDDLAEGHINGLVKRAIKKGYDPLQVIKVCTYNPVLHYDLEVGLLRQGDPADFIIADNLTDFNILETYIDGVKVAENGKSLIETEKEKAPNNFNAKPISETDIAIKAEGNEVKVIKAMDGQLITNLIYSKTKVEKGLAVSDVENDVLKIMVLNRYKDAKPALGFITNFGFKKGAIASTVAHDSHNIIAVGTNDRDLVRAVNLLIEAKGGISLVDGDKEMLLPLPVAGLMSNDNGYKVAEAYAEMSKAAKELGSKLNAPYMTLSFMALLVIPELKLSDKGLFDGERFEFTFLF